jgi:hypothetical protein
MGLGLQYGSLVVILVTLIALADWSAIQRSFLNFAVARKDSPNSSRLLSAIR